jgi:hypothetical protein
MSFLSKSLGSFGACLPDKPVTLPVQRRVPEPVRKPGKCSCEKPPFLPENTTILEDHEYEFEWNGAKCIECRKNEVFGRR